MTTCDSGGAAFMHLFPHMQVSLSDLDAACLKIQAAQSAWPATHHHPNGFAYMSHEIKEAHGTLKRSPTKSRRTASENLAWLIRLDG